LVEHASIYFYFLLTSVFNHSAGFPLAVKLGTISSEGKADVYSYSEDDMVEDPYLKKHLAHFGINMEGMKKVSTY